MNEALVPAKPSTATNAQGRVFVRVVVLRNTAEPFLAVYDFC